MRPRTLRADRIANHVSVPGPTDVDARSTAIGFVFCPARAWRGLCPGFGQRNLFGTPVAALLTTDVGERKRRERLR